MARIPALLLTLTLASGCSSDGGLSADGAGPAGDAARDQGGRDSGADDGSGTVDRGADALNSDTVEPDARLDGATPADQGADGSTPDGSTPDGSTLDGSTLPDASATCAHQIGSGSLTGSVTGQVLSASHAAAIKVTLGAATGYDISFFTKAKSCAGYTSFVLSKLWLMTCDAAAGTYDIGDSCPGSLSVVNQAGIPAAASEQKATSGTITIVSFDQACGGRVEGSFAVSFGGEQVTGSFDTISCGTDTP